MEVPSLSKDIVTGGSDNSVLITDAHFVNDRWECKLGWDLWVTFRFCFSSPTLLDR